MEEIPNPENQSIEGDEANIFNAESMWNRFSENTLKGVDKTSKGYTERKKSFFCGMYVAMLHSRALSGCSLNEEQRVERIAKFWNDLQGGLKEIAGIQAKSYVEAAIKKANEKNGRN